MQDLGGWFVKRSEAYEMRKKVLHRNVRVIKNDGAHRSSTFFANGGATVRKRFACVVGRMKSAALLAMLHWSVKRETFDSRCLLHHCLLMHQHGLVLSCSRPCVGIGAQLSEGPTYVNASSPPSEFA